MNMQEQPLEVFRWPTTYKKIDYDLVVYDNGVCHVIDAAAYTQAMDILNETNDEVSRLLFRLCDDELWREFSVETTLDFETYYMIREAHLGLMQDKPITKQEATRLEDRLNALLNGLVRRPQPKLQPTA
jgi:hypothetical protein